MWRVGGTLEYKHESNRHIKSFYTDVQTRHKLYISWEDAGARTPLRLLSQLRLLRCVSARRSFALGVGVRFLGF